MILFPNAKVNLSLRVGKKRADGYHNIQSIMYPIPLFDILEITPSKKLTFKISGQKIPGKTDQNLCLKAFNILNEKNSIPPVNIHLHKIIPIGAGLGGGSADGSFTLRGLNSLYNQNYSQNELIEFASELGSDCPFFISNAPSLSSGRGEILNPMILDIVGMSMVIINHGIHISTAEAYQQVSSGEPILSEVNLNHDKTSLFELMGNDFQQFAEKQHPVLRKTREKLMRKGARYAGMTGSGSSYFGLFNSPINISSLDFGDAFIRQFPLT